MIDEFIANFAVVFLSGVIGLTILFWVLNYIIEQIEEMSQFDAGDWFMMAIFTGICLVVAGVMSI